MLHQSVSAGEEFLRKVEPLHILVCPDQPSWAFDNIADNISRYAGVNRVSKLYMRDVIGNEHRFYEAIFLKRVDLCHIFWREDLFHLFRADTIDKAARQMGVEPELIVGALAGCAFTTSIYDHLFSSGPDIRERRAGFALADGYTVSSERLRKIYSDQPDLPKPDAVITDGVDTDHFSPRTAARKEGDPFLIGWVGNSAWGRESNGYDVKGYGRLFEPMMNFLAASGHAVEQRVADPQVNRVAFADMPDFYRQLDVFVCTSAIEGTPNPVLEAMASGVPVVSTDVGVVPEVFGALQRRFIQQYPDPVMFADAVAEIMRNPELRAALGRENRQQALAWSWERKTSEWWPFWRSVTERAADPRAASRREFCMRALAAAL